MPFGRLSPSDKPRPMAEINVTPLVDVMLVLLVVFIVAAPVLAERLALELARAATATPHAAGVPAVRVSLDREGQWHWNGEPVTAEALQARLADTARLAPQTEIQIEADAQAPYGQVLRVIGQARQIGLTRLGFVADPSER